METYQSLADVELAFGAELASLHLMIQLQNWGDYASLEAGQKYTNLTLESS